MGQTFTDVRLQKINFHFVEWYNHFYYNKYFKHCAIQRIGLYLKRQLKCMVVIEMGIISWRAFVSTLFATYYSGTTRITYNCPCMWVHRHVCCDEILINYHCCQKLFKSINGKFVFWPDNNSLFLKPPLKILWKYLYYSKSARVDYWKPDSCQLSS